MKTAGISLVLILLVLCCAGVGRAQKPAAKGQQPAAGSPAAVVRELYRIHKDGYGPLFTKEGRKAHEQFFDDNLAKLIWKDLTETPEGEVGHIDFDPLYNAQETQIKNFNVGAGSVEGDTATVPVTFLNFNKKVTITYRLVKTSAGWKISNIVYDEDSDFLKILTMPLG